MRPVGVLSPRRALILSTNSHVRTLNGPDFPGGAIHVLLSLIPVCCFNMRILMYLPMGYSISVACLLLLSLSFSSS